jgi:dienelactone hydrolase
MSDGVASPALDISPTRPLLDEELAVRVTGIDSGDRVTLRVRERHWDTVFESTATFEASDGTVDPSEDAPVDGAYRGVRPMGLFQFMREAEESVGFTPDSGSIDPADDGTDELTFPGRIRATVDGTVVDEAASERVVRPPEVTKRDLDHPELVGHRYLPAGDGPHPGVVWFGGSEGGYPGEVVASLLAARGYAVLGLAYFGIEGLPDHLVDVPVEYFERAVEWFGDREGVRSEPLGVMSVSRGSEMALWLGAKRPEVRTVVARAPSDVLYGGIWTGKPDEWAPPGAAWTRDGDPLPHVPVETGLTDTLRWVWRGLRGKTVDISHTYEDGRESVADDRLAAATLPVEETDGPVLLVSGEDDRLWPSTWMAENIGQRLDERGYDHRLEHCRYPDAGHAISAPYRPVVGRETSEFVFGSDLALGGTPDGYADADADSWSAVLDVLDDGLR